MDALKNVEIVYIKQKVEWLEVFTDLEGKNKYSILDQQKKRDLFCG